MDAAAAAASAAGGGVAAATWQPGAGRGESADRQRIRSSAHQVPGIVGARQVNSDLVFM